MAQSSLLRSCRADQWTYIHFFLGRLAYFSEQLTSICAYNFNSNWQLPFLNQRKGKNDHRNDFMINLHESYRDSNLWLPDPGSAVRSAMIMKPDSFLLQQKSFQKVFGTVQSAQPYYVSFSLANEERINFLASSVLFPRSFHALSTIISRLSHATNPTATRNVKFACHSIVPRSPRATGKIASSYTLQPIATCLHFILDQYRIRSSDPNVFTRVR